MRSEPMLMLEVPSAMGREEGGAEGEDGVEGTMEVTAAAEAAAAAAAVASTAAHWEVLDWRGGMWERFLIPI
ncbi:hypothetical protein CBR_g12567 [Chara braunii]|uniref:Uncharacterized protein n=1 Tax=Chara braunii TaxID=69332 RepID=A0A388KS28_CHABU|nr:hypothetical protein CBR_g12567 [Chara braunii]|eukprot:GBG72847.1 hypothetical protein CBR_g12567 [Chara braunii]